MIPKIIHYCWFGGRILPDLAQKCIASWKEYLFDYEIKEWNEQNFDINNIPYVKEAYEAGKFAFVADYVRLYALYMEGGIYMDTDVEVVRNLDVFLHHSAFLGFESKTTISTGIIASEKGGIWVKEILEYYQERHFIKLDGKLDLTTNVVTITNYMCKCGLKQDNTYQDVLGLFTIYPQDYFSPKSCGRILSTKNTYCIHYFAGSWLPKKQMVINYIAAFVGPQITHILGKIRRFVFQKK
ncbi:glycosyltransferase family 32 protein [Bacteroides oleiciplenus]|uniref:glycosyltransferase family 32 protein n=1 Tax=Bacteroides oleiciplenus TaxID=626931 RepID=UPI0026DBEA10|nr:glycosyltransferase [Bacteroides oleiciplenus]